MKQVGLVTVVSVIACAAAPVSQVRNGSATFATARSVEQFGTCFVGAQDRAAQAWSYVPKGDGGTFSNVGATGAGAPYFLAVSDRGSERHVQLEAAGAARTVDRNIARAVDQCI